MRGHAPHVGERRPARATRLNDTGTSTSRTIDQIAGRQRVEHGGHRALDRVLDRDDGEVGRAGAHRIERGDDVRLRQVVGLVRRGDLAQRRLGERPGRAEVGVAGTGRHGAEPSLGQPSISRCTAGAQCPA